MNWLGQRFDRDGLGHKFVGKSKPYLAQLLEVEKEDEFKKVVMTSAVNCQTVKNRVGSQIIDECRRRHFEREIEFWKPKAFVAMGNKAERLLKGCDIDYIKILHPTHRYSKETELRILEDAKSKLREIGFI